MQILDVGSDALSNAEVLAHLNDIQDEWIRDRRLKEVPLNARKAAENVQTHLRRPTQPTCPKPPSSLLEIQHQHPSFTPPVFAALAARLKRAPYSLMPAEILQIFNHVPRNRLELVVVVEEGEDRFPEAVLEGMLKLIEDVLVRGKELPLLATQSKRRKRKSGGAVRKAKR